MIKTVERASEFASARDETASAMGFLRSQNFGFALMLNALAYSQ
jgi:hypothetical protein